MSSRPTEFRLAHLLPSLLLRLQSKLHVSDEWYGIQSQNCSSLSIVESDQHHDGECLRSTENVLDSLQQSVVRFTVNTASFSRTGAHTLQPPKALVHCLSVFENHNPSCVTHRGLSSVTTSDIQIPLHITQRTNEIAISSESNSLVYAKDEPSCNNSYRLHQQPCDVIRQLGGIPQACLGVHQQDLSPLHRP